DLLETHHDHRLGWSDRGDGETATDYGIQLSVVAQRQRIAGEGLHAQFAGNAMRRAADGHLDANLQSRLRGTCATSPQLLLVYRLFAAFSIQTAVLSCGANR